MRRSHVLVFALASVVAPLHAQRPVYRISGVVADSVGKAIELAAVTLTDMGGARHLMQSDSAGHFVFTQVPRGRAAVTVRRLGFHPFSKTIDAGESTSADSLSVTLLSFPLGLTAVDVTETSGGAPAEFYDRRQNNHFGRFIDRVVLDKTFGQTVSEALRGMPGVQVLPSTRIGNMVRLRGCRPNIWVNGLRVKGAELDEVATVSDVAAMEIYNSMIGLPVQYTDRTNPCGAILLWSRA